LENEELRKNMQRKVYSYSRDFTWAVVAKRYAGLFRRMINS